MNIPPPRDEPRTNIGFLHFIYHQSLKKGLTVRSLAVDIISLSHSLKKIYTLPYMGVTLYGRWFKSLKMFWLISIYLMFTRPSSRQRVKFNASHPLSVKFADGSGQSEGAVDRGGPTREFLRLAIRQMFDSKMFGGTDRNKVFLLDQESE